MHVRNIDTRMRAVVPCAEVRPIDRMRLAVAAGGLGEQGIAGVV